MEQENVVVTEEILKDNPELADAGIEVGDVGVVLSEEEVALEAEAPVEEVA